MTIIKKGGKYYRREIDDQEIKLSEMEEELTNLRQDKIDSIREKTEYMDRLITGLEGDITALKKLNVS